MTARDALDMAAHAALGERLHRFQAICSPNGSRHRQSLTLDPGRWTWCPDCLTVSDDFGAVVNEISELANAGVTESHPAPWGIHLARRVLSNQIPLESRRFSLTRYGSRN